MNVNFIFATKVLIKIFLVKISNDFTVNYNKVFFLLPLIRFPCSHCIFFSWYWLKVMLSSIQVVVFVS